MTDPAKILDAMKTATDALNPLEEEERSDALNWIAKTLGVKIDEPSGRAGSQGDTEHATGDAAVPDSEDPKEFMAQKNPKTHIEKVTCLAYFLTHHRSMKTFKTSDLTKLATEAHQAQFNTSQSVANAIRRNGYFRSGQGNTYLITTDGEKLVRALPDPDAAKKVQSATARRRGARKQKASSKKR